MKNADKVRNMTDEELAFVLMCPYEVEEGMCNQKHHPNCYHCVLEWLGKEEERVTGEYDIEKHMREVTE